MKSIPPHPSDSLSVPGLFSNNHWSQWLPRFKSATWPALDSYIFQQQTWLWVAILVNGTIQQVVNQSCLQLCFVMPYFWGQITVTESLCSWKQYISFLVQWHLALRLRKVCAIWNEYFVSVPQKWKCILWYFLILLPGEELLANLTRKLLIFLVGTKREDTSRGGRHLQQTLSGVKRYPSWL